MAARELRNQAEAVRVLLVEDDPDFADAAVELLEEALPSSRVAVTLAASLAEGKAAYARARFDLVVTDHRLGDGSGLDLVRAVRAVGGAPTIVLTAGGNEELAVAAMRSGATDYLAKSRLSVELLGATVRRALDVASSERARVAAEGALQRLAAIVEASADAIVGLDADGVIESWNLGATRIFGVERAWAVGRSIDSVCPALPGGDFATLAATIDRGGAIDGFECERATRDGDVVALALTLSPVRARGGASIGEREGDPRPRPGGRAIAGYAFVARDVTALRDLRAQVVAADRLAAVGALASGVGHEINNPLASVMANVDYAAAEVRASLGDGDVARLDEVAIALDEAKAGAERVRDVVRDLKKCARPGDEERTAVDVNAVVDAQVALAWNEIRHRARLVRAAGEIPAVDANPSSLGQIVLNLLLNAAQAIPEGAADVHAITVRTRAHERRVVVEVEDTGVGIPEDLRGRIFEPFFTTKGAGEGTGLGLSVAEGIATSLGGSIRAEEGASGGTRMVVSLPASKTAAFATDAAPRGRGRVLVVDDEPLVAATLRRILARDHDVTAVVSSREALERVRGGERYDAILCDLMMPELSGMDLHDGVRGLDAAQASRMVFVTGGAFTPRARAFLASVPNPRIGKPFEAVDVRRVLGAIVAG